MRDFDAVKNVIDAARPEVVFHLAAQSLVRYSYQQTGRDLCDQRHGHGSCARGLPHALASRRSCASRATNAMRIASGCGPIAKTTRWAATIHTAAARAAPSWSFPPTDGRSSPSIRSRPAEWGSPPFEQATSIGGGDWAADRLIPDLVRAFERGSPPEIRSPNAVRPWQHVLEAIGGYLTIGEPLLAGNPTMADGWNFGPADDDARPVSWIVERMRAAWGDTENAAPFTGDVSHEAGLLKLDCSKSRAMLGWRPSLPLEEALAWIVDWHKRVNAGESAADVTLAQIAAYRDRTGITA